MRGRVVRAYRPVVPAPDNSVRLDHDRPDGHFTGTLGFLGESEMEDYDAVKTKVIGAMKQLFNPEFINRIDETIVFHPLTQEQIVQVVGLMVKDVQERLQDRGITFELTPGASDASAMALASDCQMALK